MAGLKIGKLRSTLKDKVTLTLQLPACVGYLDCMLETPITLRIRNGHSESFDLKVFLRDREGLLIPYEGSVQAPFESAVELSVTGIFSPLFLAEASEKKKVVIEAVVCLGEKELCKEEREVVVLPYDFWEGIEGNAERLACFVRPRIADCARLLEDAGKRLKKWNVGSEFVGYAGTDKNVVRQIAAAVYASAKKHAVERADGALLDAPVSAFQENILKSHRASPLELGIYLAACLESARLNPVIAVGKNAVGVGVWLYDSCFLDTVTDDCEIVSKYISEGINNLSFFDVEDVFSEKSVAFTPSEVHFAEKLKENFYEYFVDVRRCRLAGLPALPLKGKGLHGVELVKEADMSDENAPAPLREYGSVGLEGKQPRNRQWERRLLDLTTKNPLLNFSGKNALHVRCAEPDALLSLIEEGTELKLSSAPEKGEAFGEELSAAERELAELEYRRGILRVRSDGETLGETARQLIRKNREADEESGAKILYMAYGFLKYLSKEDGVPKYAPLVLEPVLLKRAKGNEDFSLEAQEGEFFVNSTLLEYLKQEFNIDVRGLGGDVSKLKISEIFGMMRAETASMKGWDVVKDVYLATFSFQRYLMWHDLHAHFEELSENKLVKALVCGKAERIPLPEPREEDDGDPSGTLTPLPADSSQYSAIALSRTGTSFVLHGPPGTGKSQTITNIIANALEDGKRVLFVAEKKAALDVVKKRLDLIGIGDFCLELHSNKTDKSDVLRRLDRTLQLSAAEPVAGFNQCADELKYLREELKSPMRALHKKRRLGISVYQAILLYLKNKDAPDVMDIESAFYDTLSERKLAECKNRILSAAAAAKECGGVFHSPFENVYLSRYSPQLRDKLYCSCEVLIAEIKHLRAFLELFLEFYRQKLSTVTRKKLENICTIATNLGSGMYAKYFSGVNEEQLYVFYNSNRRLDDRLALYNKHFKSLVELDREYDEVKRVLESGANWRHNKTASGVVKKLSRVALHPLEGEDAAKFLQVLVEIYDAKDRVCSVPLSKAFLDRGGDVVYRRRTEFLADWYALHDLAAQTFLDYNPDSFNGMCLRAQSGYTLPVLEGYLKAADSFFHAQEGFMELTRAKSVAQEDVLDYFSAKASALLDNIDMLPNWCMYRETEEKLKELGCHFITDALENGKLTGENILSGFEKNVYKNFLEINIPADPDLSHMTVGTLEETVEKFRNTWEEFSRMTRDKIRRDLISRLPPPDGEGSLSVEVAAFRRLCKSNLRGVGLRALFTEIPELVKRVAPCMLMSPITAAQYLKPEANLFDLVIFDEASQMTTAEAVGCIARAKAAIVVGDPRQLPPTAFFRSAYVDEENLESEDLESILDDCLALGMPERHLKWHYRSKHESLIAFSNSMFYDNKLCTFPSPDALESKVGFRYVEGVYDRGFTKRNQKEAEALVGEVVRRLKDPVLSRSSMGIVTFSSAQQNLLEKLLLKAITAGKLESAAFDRDEPLFIKNLENVQGDERDVILFSVCYGPDSTGRVSLNFGPLNQSGGWRRLNVAVSRAREEMVVFSTMTSGMIDLNKTTSKGVAGLKAFLEFAEKGRTTLAVRSQTLTEGAGIGKYLAEELTSYGYDCRVNVGTSDFKIDVAVVDPANQHAFILAVIFDGNEKFSVKDRNVLQIQTLKRANWNVIRVNCVSYYNNPKRELKRIKELLDKLTGAEKKSNYLAKYAKAYRAVKTTGAEVAAFITGGEHDAEIVARLKEIVAAEEPISRGFLRARCAASFGIAKSGTRLSSKLDSLIDGCSFRRERVNGTDYFYRNDRAIKIGRFRVEREAPLRRQEEDFTPFETVSLIKAVLEERVSVYLDELTAIVCSVYRVRATERFAGFLRDCIAYGEQKGLLVRSVSDRISLA